MIKQDTNRFTSYVISESTERAGYAITPETKYVIQNLISAYANDFFSVHFDEKEPYKSALQREFLRGAIEALEHILNSSDAISRD